MKILTKIQQKKNTTASLQARKLELLVLVNVSLKSISLISKYFTVKKRDI